MSTAVIIMTHGSRAPEWREPFERLQQQLHDSLGAGRIGLAYLEFIPPTLPEEIERLAQHFDTIRVLPLFTAHGRHVDEHIPDMVRDARRRHPDTTIELLPPLADEPRFHELLTSLVTAAAG